MGIRRLAMSAAAVAATVPLLLVATGTPANAAAGNEPDQAQTTSTCLWWYNVNATVGGVPFALTQLKLCLNSVHPNVLPPTGPIVVPHTPIDVDPPLLPVFPG
ncbi:hypothetical protein ACWGR4_07910 [Embleya sp. NPDC055664]|uniref:hypothetical protein n=1 Tax=Embleya sp. NPDC059237 TaxID=3346784 RepID=UPI003678E376